MPDELIDELDESGNVIGTIMKSVAHKLVHGIVLLGYIL